MDLAISTSGLRRTFGDFTAVDGIDLEVAPGTFFGFLGPNGAGKSTTIKMLTGVLRISSGSARVLGRNVEDEPVEVKRRIGVVPEELALFDRLTAPEYLSFVGRMHGMPRSLIIERGDELLELMALEVDSKKLIVDFSHGMKKKLSFAASLIHEPQLLFLDEPFEGIDAISSRQIKAILDQLVRSGVTNAIVGIVLGLLGIALAASALAGSHLFWYPAMIAATVTGVLLAPVDVSSGIVVVALLAMALLVWSHSVLLVLEVAMRRRTVKEELAIGAFLLMMIVSLLPALCDSGVLGARGRPVLLDILIEVLKPAAATLPPSLAANGIVALHQGSSTPAWAAAGWLVLWIAAGLAVGYVVLTRFLLDGVSVASGKAGTPRRRARAAKHGATGIDLLTFFPGGLVAVFAKEIRYLLRSTSGKLSLLIAPLFVMMIGLAVGRLSIVKEPHFGIDPGSYAFIGVLLYASLLSSNLMVNSFAWEGPGIHAYLIAPLSSRHVILGKNLGVLLFEMLVLAECLVVWAVVRGLPGLATALSGVLVFFIGLLILAPAGNFVSITFPVKRSISAIAQSASQVGTLVSFASVAVAATVGGLLLVFGMALGSGVVQVLLFLTVVVVLVVAYVFLLPLAADLFESRQERLVEALAGRDEDD